MKKILFIFIFLFSVSYSVMAQSSPDSMLNDAYSKIQVGQKLMVSAHNQIAQNPSNDNLKTAISLFSQAGQLFEEAGNILKYLGTEYTSEKDIKGCENAVNSCLENISMCREKLGYS